MRWRCSCLPPTDYTSCIISCCLCLQWNVIKFQILKRLPFEGRIISSFPMSDNKISFAIFVFSMFDLNDLWHVLWPTQFPSLWGKEHRENVLDMYVLTCCLYYIEMVKTYYAPYDSFQRFTSRNNWINSVNWLISEAKQVRWVKRWRDIISSRTVISDGSLTRFSRAARLSWKCVIYVSRSVWVLFTFFSSTCYYHHHHHHG